MMLCGAGSPASGLEAIPLAFSVVFIFLGRLADMSLDTMRMLFVVRGRRLWAAVFGALEAAIYIAVVAQILTGAMHWLHIVGYGAGFGAGTWVGMMIGEYVASGYVLARILSHDHSESLCEKLRAEGFGITAVPGEAHKGTILILFSVIRRAHGQRLIESVRGVDEHAFITIEPVERAMGQYLPHPGLPGVATGAAQ